MKSSKLLWVALSALSLIAYQAAFAGTDSVDSKTVATNNAAAPEKGAPLPLHDVEGNGGILVTQSAYIVNPPRDGQAVGLPSIGTGFISLGHGQILVPTTATWSPTSRVELGYGWDYFNLGTLPGKVNQVTGVRIQQQVYLNNFNARFQLIKENDFGTKWLPAVTFGVAYKYNSGIAQINHNLGNLLSKIGTGGDQGVDFTLYGTKLLTFIPNHPILLDAGIRETRGQELGLLGFSNKYTALFEGNAAIFLTKWLILAGEFRAQPNAYTAIPGVIGKSGNWTTVDLAWIVNKHLTIAGGYGYFGQVLNGLDNGVFGVTAKYEF